MDYYNAAVAASGKRDGYIADPWQAAYYLQDKMEWEGMIVNAGLRLDMWYLGNKYQVAQDNGTYRMVEFPKEDRLQMMLSPRLGVSHPIDEYTVLRFAYNYQISFRRCSLSSPVRPLPMQTFLIRSSRAVIPLLSLRSL
jgi:hypothetical protein